MPTNVPRYFRVEDAERLLPDIRNAIKEAIRLRRQHEAAETLLASATTSYDASLDAYGYGVKNLVDLVTAENQLAQARLAVVQSRSAVRISAANLDYATGNLLRRQPPIAQPVIKNP